MFVLSLFHAEDASVRFLHVLLAGQTAAGSQGPAGTEQEVLPTPNQRRKRGRPRKTPKLVQDESLDYAKAEAADHQDSGGVPQSPEMTPSGRPTRRAAKAYVDFWLNSES